MTLSPAVWQPKAAALPGDICIAKPNAKEPTKQSPAPVVSTGITFCAATLVIAPSAIHKNSSHTALFQDQLTRLRKQDLEISDQAPESDVDRKIQLALASKSILLVEINANGKVMNFVLEPIGLANGRLRARDRKADIERTLPVSAITSIVIG